MSLFMAKEWWGLKLDSDEEFSEGALLVSNIDNDPNGLMKIVTGSLKGLLRIYLPQAEKENRIEDLLLEQDLGSPILQIEAGRFSSSMRDATTLAVLHPHELKIYCVQRLNDSGSDGLHLECLYKHQLGEDGEHFTAYSMISGPFGRARNKDLIAVLSMDGFLEVFEQESKAFTRELNLMLLPGPICYVAETDCIVVCNSSMAIDCYKYSMLAASRSAAKQGRADGSSQKTSLMQTDWSINIGEPVRAILPARISRSLSGSQIDIVVLCERTLYYVKERGSFRQQKRLANDMRASCIFSYNRSAAQGDQSQGGTSNLLIGTEESHIRVYRDTMLVWASSCQLSTAPVALAVGDFRANAETKRGLIVSLSRCGELLVSFMGTDPPTSVVGASEPAHHLNYENMDAEHRALLQRIRRSQSAPQETSREIVQLKCSVPSTLDEVSSEDDALAKSDVPNEYYACTPDGRIVQLTIQVQVTRTGMDAISDVNVSLNLPAGVVASEPTFVMPAASFAPRKSSAREVQLRVLREGIVTSLDLSITASFHLGKDLNTSQNVTSTARLPLSMSCMLRAPIKNPGVKITLDTNREPLRLAALFDDMLQGPGLSPDLVAHTETSENNVISLSYYNGVDVTILVSRQAGRYRVQANELDAIWLIFAELQRRLSEYFEVSGGKALEMSFTEKLPLGPLFSLIDTHFNARGEYVKAASELNDRSHQFRSVQKRLLSRFKDKNATPLGGLDMVLAETYNDIMQLSNRMEELLHQAEFQARRLSSALQLLLKLLQLQFSLDDTNYALISAYLSPFVSQHGIIDGWEERTDAAMTYLLRTLLAKVNKQSSHAPRTVLAFPSDTKKLKKHITIVCDRLSKGSLLSKKSTESAKK